MNYFCNLLYFSKLLNLGVELPEDDVTPKHVWAI